MATVRTTLLLGAACVSLAFSSAAFAAVDQPNPANSPAVGASDTAPVNGKDAMAAHKKHAKKHNHMKKSDTTTDSTTTSK